MQQLTRSVRNVGKHTDTVLRSKTMHKINHGQYPIYFWGSGITVWRSVWERDGKFFVKWYKQNVEVKQNERGNYVTVLGF